MKEEIKTKDGKRKLYFTTDMQVFISYNLEQKTTCESIFQSYKDSILAKLCEMFNNPNININNFDFFLIDLKGIKKAQGNLFTKIRLNRNIIIYNFLQNPKTILCFLPKNPFNYDSKIIERNKILNDKKNITNDKLSELKKKYLINKQTDDFFTHKTIFLYNYESNSYIKLKANLSEKQLTIQGKNEKIILIQDINTLNYYDAKNPMVDSLYVASGFKPPFYIFIKTNDEQIIIGLKKEEKLKKWKIGLNFVLANYKTYTTDIDLKINLNNLKTSLLENEKNIIENSLLIYENMLKNKEKKNIFYSLFEDEKLAKLIEDIFIYENLIKNNNFKEGLLKLYEILDNVTKNNKEEEQNKKSDISGIIDEKRLYKYVEIYNKANELITKENNENLKDVLKADLFDDSLFYVNQLYITPYIKKNKEKFGKPCQTQGKSDLRKNIQSIIAYYYMKIYQMNNKESFLEL